MALQELFWDGDMQDREAPQSSLESSKTVPKAKPIIPPIGPPNAQPSPPPNHFANLLMMLYLIFLKANTHSFLFVKYALS